MAVFAIPNPKKILTIDFPIEQVKKGVNNLYLIDNKYKLFNSNDLFNQYTFDLYVVEERYNVITFLSGNASIMNAR
jgi:hypothetical protein